MLNALKDEPCSQRRNSSGKHAVGQKRRLIEKNLSHNSTECHPSTPIYLPSKFKYKAKCSIQLDMVVVVHHGYVR